MAILIILVALAGAALITVLATDRRLIEGATLLAAVMALVEAVIVSQTVAALGSYDALTFFSVDSLGALLLLIIACISLATVAYSIPYLRTETAKNIISYKQVQHYYLLLNLFMMAMFLAVSSSSPIFTWISIEATTLATAFLISFYNKPTATEAAWKYLIINSIGLLLGFFGTLLYFTSIEANLTSGFISWQGLAIAATHLDPVIARIAFIFVLVGYGTKVGLAPMHTWLPDAHSKAPVPISALLSGVLLNVALMAVLRFKLITDLVIGPDFTGHLFLLFGGVSILFAALIIFTQKNYKRLLAYSSVENMGIILLGFGLGGLGALAAVFHMMYHAFIKSALFLASGTIFLNYSSTKIANVKGVLTAIPITGGLFLAGFFAITGAPPVGIFLTKLSILAIGIKTYPVSTVLVLLLMAVLFIGFLKHTSAMMFGEKPTQLVATKESVWLILPPLALLVIVLYLGFWLPPFLQILINNVAVQY
ncbi:MAG: proton-conducting transporter membrane subunit [Patescibacteria group bacterium]